MNSSILSDASDPSDLSALPTVPEKIELIPSVLLTRVQTMYQGVNIDITIGKSNDYLPEIAGCVYPDGGDDEFAMDTRLCTNSPYNTELKVPGFETADTYPSEVAATLECSRKMRFYLERLKDMVEGDIYAMIVELDFLDETLKGGK